MLAKHLKKAWLVVGWGFGFGFGFWREGNVYVILKGILLIFDPFGFAIGYSL